MAHTKLLIDFGQSFYAFVYGTVAGGLTAGFQPNIYGTRGAIVGTKFGDRDLKFPEDHSPNVVGEHVQMSESHVFEDMMQLVDWVREGKLSIANAEHARHDQDAYSRPHGQGDRCSKLIREDASHARFREPLVVLSIGRTAG